MQSISFFVYRVQLQIPGVKQPLPQNKLHKSYEEFQKLEQIVREQAIKQSWFFNYPSMIDEDGVCN